MVSVMMKLCSLSRGLRGEIVKDNSKNSCSNILVNIVKSKLYIELAVLRVEMVKDNSKKSCSNPFMNIEKSKLYIEQNVLLRSTESLQSFRPI